MGLTQQYHGSFIGSDRQSVFDNQIRTVNYMTLLRYIRDEDANTTYGCLRPNCSDPNTKIEERKAKLVETLIHVFESDPDAKIPNICNCEDLVDAVCCNASYADVAAGYNTQTDTDDFFM